MVRHLVFALLAGAAGGSLASAQPAPTPAPDPTPAEVARPAGAVAAAKSVQRLASPLGCDRLTLAEGLPNSNVRVIVQDKRGFVWFGTQDGLVRYDGIKMRVYRPSETDPKTVSSGYITALVSDVTGKLWVGTAEHGVNLYDPDTDQFTRYAHGAKGGISSEGVTAITRDSKDRIWLAMSGGGLNRFEPATGTFTEYLTKPLDAVITAIDADQSGTLWLGTASVGVIQWNPDTGATASYRPTPGDAQGLGTAPITAILAASQGTLWIGTDGEGPLVLDPATRAFVRHRPAGSVGVDDHISTLFEDQAKNLWIGTTNGLNRLDPAGGLIQYLHDPNDPTSLPSPGVESIYQDSGGVMWVGGFTVGVCKFDEFRLKFGHYRTRTHANSFFEDTDGTLWLGTYNDGLHKYERRAQRVTAYHSLQRSTDPEGDPVALDSAWITALHRDRRGTLWISLKGQGLIAFDTKTEKHRQYLPDPDKPNGLPVDTMFDIWEDSKGLLWLATWGGGLVRFDPELEIFTAFTTESTTTADAADDTSGLSSNHLYTLYPDPADPQVLWVGTAKGGVVRFNIATGTAKHYRNRAEQADSISSDDVTTIHRDAGGSVWLGTYGGGLNRLDPTTGKAERFTTSNSALTNDAVLGVLPDRDGGLWLSTNGGGLLHFDPKTKQFLAYDASDGAQDSEFSQGSFLAGASGELFFGGAGGFNAFFPRDIKRDAYVPPVVITAFKVFNQEVELDRPIWMLPELEVSYSDSFEVQFAALSFAAPTKNRYAYKLEGFDDKFIETDRPFATYTKLDGGKYTLRIRAANRHGVWNETGVALKLAVTPPIWRTWQAFVVYLLLMAGAAYLLFRTQRQRVRRAEREGRLAVVERDLALTGAVQTGFLPEHNEITTARVQLVGLYRPADACGGDWWWHEQLSGGRHVIMVGDVTGHGPGPAMVTAAVATAFRVLVENGLDDVQQALELLNRQVLWVAKGKYHMTMAALELDEATGRWVFYSAGAPPILSLGGSGKHKVHFCAGAPLGTEVGFETGRVEGKLEPTDRILMYTDGIPEIELPNGNVMGMRRFAQQYEQTRGRGLHEAAAHIVVYADQTSAGQPQADDWTFAMIEWA
ncbi:MAG: SpoIIE family protein phosphatase [Deltaproteobacteria bacterium]|nr:SpoIIE family protein phosphatase [Deltaproteobacteria bacterium]